MAPRSAAYGTPPGRERRTCGPGPALIPATVVATRAASAGARGYPPAREWAEQAVAISVEQSFPETHGLGMVIRGWTLADSRTAHEGISELEQGLDETLRAGTEVIVPYFLGLLADSCRSVGREEDATGALEGALALSQAKGLCFWDAELHRLQGEILLGRDHTLHEKAEGCLRRALEIARTQEAKSFELRAATSLARLWQRQGRKEEAHAILQPVYDWFTEGFDTADLKDAKALLEEPS